jgi:hypothetical protein
MADVEVYVRDPDAPESLTDHVSDLVEVRTGSDGRFTLEAVVGRRLSVTAERGDRVAMHRLVDVERVDGPVELVLAKGRRVTVVLVDEHGKPLEGARVSASGSVLGVGGDDDTFHWSALEAGGGTYVFSGLPDGEVRLQVSYRSAPNVTISRSYAHSTADPERRIEFPLE